MYIVMHGLPYYLYCITVRARSEGGVCLQSDSAVKPYTLPWLLQIILSPQCLRVFYILNSYLKSKLFKIN